MLPPLRPSTSLTVTGTVPLPPAGTGSVSVCAFTRITLVAFASPKRTVVPSPKPVPVIVTSVVALGAPASGEMASTRGACTYVTAEASVPNCRARFVTTIASVPAAPAGATALIWEALTTSTSVASTPPTVTVAPASNPVPAIVGFAPPAVVTFDGVAEVTVGAAAYLDALESVEVSLSGFVNVTPTEPVPADATALSEVALSNVTPVAAVLPNLLVAPATNPVPVIATVVPPASGPRAGSTAVTFGGGVFT